MSVGRIDAVERFEIAVFSREINISVSLAPGETFNRRVEVAGQGGDFLRCDIHDIELVVIHVRGHSIWQILADGAKPFGRGCKRDRFSVGREGCATDESFIFKQRHAGT